MRGKKTGGRKAGTQNKMTLTVKESVLNTFLKLQSNPKYNLEAFAELYPREFYAIAAKLIPTEISAQIEAKVIKVVRE